MVVKVIEVLSQSEKSWEDAAQKAVTEASKTIRDIKSVYVKEFQAVVENGRIVQYRIDAKISFGIHNDIRKTKNPGRRSAAEDILADPQYGSLQTAGL